MSDQYIIERNGRCYLVITSGCVQGKKVCKTCEEEGEIFRIEVETDCASCGNCE